MPLTADDIETMKGLKAKYEAMNSEEDRASNKALGEAMMADEEKKQAWAAKVAGFFTEADANGDGALDGTEWTAFVAKMHEAAKAGGMKIPDIDAADEQTRFGIFDRWNPESNGVTLADYWGCWKESMAAMK